MAENIPNDAGGAAYGQGFTSSHRIHSVLTAGNVVTVAIQLFREKSDDYITTSLQSYLWLFLTGLGASFCAGIGSVIGQTIGLSNWTELGILSLLFTLPLLAFGRGRKTAIGGVLSQLVFNKLVSRSETKEDIQKRLFPRIWTFFRGEVLFWLALAGIYFVLAFILGLILRVFFSSIRDPDFFDFFTLSEQDFSSVLLTLITVIVLFLLLYIGLFLFFSYFIARLWLFDVVIAFENVSAREAIRRSWQLTQRQGWQSLSVVIICGLLLIPPFSMSMFLSIFSVFAILFIMIAAFPVYQAIKAVIYYDLRSRNEGLTFDLDITATNPQNHLRRVMLQTPESIELDLALGGIGSRTLAWAIDQLLLWVGICLFWYFGSILYLSILLPVLTNASAAFDQGELNQWIEAIATFLTFALSNCYFIVFETLWQGQTPGKRIAKIRVVRDTGQPVGIKESSIRSLLNSIDVFFFFVGVILITVTQSEKRLGDLVAGTLVVQDQQQGANETQQPFDFSPISSQLATELVTNPQLKTITPDQFLTLRDFLGYRSQLVSRMRSQVTTKLADQLRTLLGQNNQPLALGLDDLELVEATYLACQQANQS